MHITNREAANWYNRYAAIPLEGMTPAELEAWSKSQKIIQLRVIIFLKRWIDGYHTDFEEEGTQSPTLLISLTPTRRNGRYVSKFR